MKYIILLLIILFSPLLGSESEEAWIKALLAIDNRDWPGAEKFLDVVILNMLSVNDNSRAYVYVQRANAYYRQEKYSQALEDLEKAFHSGNLQGADLTQAFLTRSSIYSDLDNRTLALENMNKCMDSIPNKPEIEFGEEYIIIRNMLDNECYKNLIKIISIKANVCESEEDIQMLSSGVCLIKRKNRGGKKPENSEEKKTECQEEECTSRKSSSKLVFSDREGCCYWCDSLAILGQGWCGKVFPSIICNTSCLIAVDYIKRICYRCCTDGDPYQTCVQPYEDIILYMGEACTPLCEG